MKYLRLLIPMALLFVAVPAFAVCGYCDYDGTCVWSPGLYSRCHYDFYICTTVCVEEAAPGCGPRLAAESFTSQYSITSVKVEAAKATPIKQEIPAVPAKKSKTTV